MSNFNFIYLAGGKIYTCKNCSKSYNRSYNLQRHYNYECGVEPKFKCPVCPYQARYRSYLKSHIFVKHTVETTNNVHHKNFIK